MAFQLSDPVLIKDESDPVFSTRIEKRSEKASVLSRKGLKKHHLTSSVPVLHAHVDDFQMEPCQENVQNLEYEVQPILPTFEDHSDTHGFWSITGDTLASIAQHKNVIIVDARFSYEFDGGHIGNARNISDNASAEEYFFKGNVVRACFIFHCEFSQCRSLEIMKYVRNRDRCLNMHRHPMLSYPHIYLLHGGYQDFFVNHRKHWYVSKPNSSIGEYIEMFDARYQDLCRDHLSLNSSMAFKKLADSFGSTDHPIKKQKRRSKALGLRRNRTFASLDFSRSPCSPVVSVASSVLSPATPMRSLDFTSP